MKYSSLVLIFFIFTPKIGLTQSGNTLLRKDVSITPNYFKRLGNIYGGTIASKVKKDTLVIGRDTNDNIGILQVEGYITTSTLSGHGTVAVLADNKGRLFYNTIPDTTTSLFSWSDTLFSLASVSRLKDSVSVIRNILNNYNFTTTITGNTILNIPANTYLVMLSIIAVNNTSISIGTTVNGSDILPITSIIANNEKSLPINTHFTNSVTLYITQTISTSTTYKILYN